MSGPTTMRAVLDQPVSAQSSVEEPSSHLAEATFPQDVVAAACAERGEAADRANGFVTDAQRLAGQVRGQVDDEFERARHVFADWAADRYTVAESVIAELVENARKEAAFIRAEAITAAMTEAEVAARECAQRQMEHAVAEAGELRDEARKMILRSASLIENATVSGHETISTLAGCLDALEEQCAAMRSLAAEVDAGVVSGSVEMAETPAAVRALVPKPDGHPSDAPSTGYSERANAAAAIRRATPGAAALAVPTQSLLHTPEAS